MSKTFVFLDHVFDLDTAHFVAEDRYLHVARTQLGSWFVYDESEEKILTALLCDDPESNPVGFAETLVNLGFADVLAEHFPEIAADVLPSA